MKVTFTGTPNQIKKEMEHWLSSNQESTHNETLEDKVTLKLSKHNLKLTANVDDVLPLAFVKQACQLQGHDWFQFKDQLENCGSTEKRTAKGRLLTNLALIKED